MRMKHFSKLDCFWNLKFNKLEFQPIPSWMKFGIDHKKKKKRVELEFERLEFH